MHNACMPTLQIRDFPAPLYQRLSLRAQQSHRSLTQQAVAELEAALMPTAGSMRRQMALQKLQTLSSPAGVQTISSAQIEQWQRTDREREHG